MRIELPVCICGENRNPEEHTEDIHDLLTGQCLSFCNGVGCDCTHFRPSGRKVSVETDS